MDSQKLNLFFIQNAKYFTSLQAADLRERMATLHDESVLLCTSQLKDPVVMLLISGSSDIWSDAAIVQRI